MAESGNNGKVVLIDTDAGTDDALAIMACLRAHLSSEHDFRVVGITCVNGNTKVDHVTRNVTRVLETVSSELLNEIPIFRGSEAPIVHPYEPLEHGDAYFHGIDGFGDAEDLPSIEPKLHAEYGVVAITRLAHQYKGRLTILALGPLTNLAMAVRLDPSIGNYIGNIYVMGGNIEGVGNTTVSGEFNFVVDPEAAFITLSSYKCPIHIVPWELCLRQGSRPYEWRVNAFTKLGTPCASLMNSIERKILERLKAERGNWIACDQIVASSLIEPSAIKSTKEHYCTVELQGSHTRGLMIVDYPRFLKKEPNVNVIVEIDPEMLDRIYIWALGGPNYKLSK